MMNRVLKNEWVAESSGGGLGEGVVTKVNHNFVTLYHEPKKRLSGAGIVFAALIILTVAAAACGLAAVL